MRLLKRWYPFSGKYIDMYERERERENGNERSTTFRKLQIEQKKRDFFNIYLGQSALNQNMTFIVSADIIDVHWIYDSCEPRHILAAIWIMHCCQINWYIAVNTKPYLPMH